MKRFDFKYIKIGFPNLQLVKCTKNFGVEKSSKIKIEDDSAKCLAGDFLKKFLEANIWKSPKSE